MTPPLSKYNEIRRTVGAYQVLVSVNPFIAADLARVTKTTSELMNDYRESNTTEIFSSEDAGFIELKHDFKYSQGSKAKGPTISLKCYDPGIGFLSDLYFNFIGRSLEQISEAKSLEQNELKAYYEKLNDAEQAVARETTNLGKLEDVTEREQIAREELARRPTISSDLFTVATEEERLQALLTGVDPYLIDLEQEVRKKLGQAISDQKELLGEIQSIISQRSLPKVYVMYGVGQDLNDWAGPFETYLGEVRHENDGKSETTEYIFSVDLLSEQFNDPGLFDKQTKIDKVSFFDKTSTPLTAMKYFGGTSDGLYRTINFTNRPGNFHDAIVSLMSNYLFQLGIKNHLIILPNINTMLGPLITAALTNVLSTNAKLRSLSNVGRTDRRGFFGGSVVYDPTRLVAPWDGLTGSSKEFAINYFLSNLFNVDDPERLAEQLKDIYQIGPGPWATAGRLSRFRGYSNTEILNLFTFAGAEIIKKVFESIGLKQTAANDESSSVDPALGVNQVKGDEPETLVTCVNPFDVKSYSRGWTFGEIEANIITRLNFPEVTEEGSEPIETGWESPLVDLVNGLNSCTGGDIIRLSNGYVTDVELGKRIKNVFGGGTYAGYANFPGAPPTNHTPLFVLGDRDLVRLLLYGDLYKLQQKDARYNDVEFLSETGDLPARMIDTAGGVSLSDPFWNIVGKEIAKNIHRPSNNNYLKEMYHYLHPQGNGLNLGYFTGLMEDWESLKAALPDEFARQPDEVYEDLFEMDLPIFMANTQAANILSYSFDVNKFLYGSLFGSIQEIYYNTTRRYLRTNNPILAGSLDPDEILDKTKELMDNLRSRSGLAGRAMSVTTGVGTPVNAEEVYDNLAQILFIENKTGINMAVNGSRASSIVAMLLLFLDIFERQYIGSLKTLPQFQLSKHSTLNKSCLSIIKSARKLNPPMSGLSGEDIRPVADYLSGMYRILGFQHVITGSDAYSEFNIVKDVIGEMSNEV